MDSYKNKDEIYNEDSPPPASISLMQLVSNKFRPFLSSPDDEKNLMHRLNSLGVKTVDDLELLNFETDLQGIMTVVQCHKLKQELSKGIVKN